MLRGFRSTGDREAQAVLRRAAPIAGGDVPREKGVTRAHGGHRLEWVEGDSVELRVGLADQADAPRAERHDRLAGAEADDLVETGQAILIVRELVAHQLLGLELVGRDDRGLGARAEQHGVAFGVEHRGDAELAQLLDQARVDVGVDPARQAAREHAHARALGEIEELVDEQLELGLGDRRAALVDLGLLARGGVDDGGRHARFLADADEVAEDRLLGQLLDDAGAVRPSGYARGDHRLTQRLQRAGHVHALAAGHGGLLDGAVPPPQTEVRNRKRLVDRGVECDRDDHLADLARCSRMARARSATSVPTTRIRSSATVMRAGPRLTDTLRTTPAPGTSAAVTRGTVLTTLPSTITRTLPTCLRAGSGPSSWVGASTRTDSGVPRRSVSATLPAGVSAAFPSRQRTFALATVLPATTGRTRRYWSIP